MERSEETDNSVITSAVIRGTGRSLLIRICWLLGVRFLSLGNWKGTQSHVLILVSLSFHFTLVNLVLFIVIEPAGDYILFCSFIWSHFILFWLFLICRLSSSLILTSFLFLTPQFCICDLQVVELKKKKLTGLQPPGLILSHLILPHLILFCK